LIHLPEKFTQTIMGVHQDKGKLWLDDLHGLIQYCEDKWSLQVLNPYPLSYNYVAPAVYKNGLEAVLKLGVPSKEVHYEIEALRLYNGNGMAKLIDSDAEKGILILERAKPGETLKSIKNDEEATLIAADIMIKLRVPAPCPLLFPSTSQWADGLMKLRSHYQGSTGQIPEYLVRKAEERFTKLNSTIKKVQLLHGDLHHENILSTEREPWLAIDPKGLVGEAEYEVISFLMNNLPEDQPIEIIKRRVDLFVEKLQLNKERVLAWAFCHAILSAWWCIEDNTEGADDAVEMALLFERLLSAQ
jgi:streptomycin 6-kinase